MAKSFLVIGGSGLLGEKILALLTKNPDYKTFYTYNRNDISVKGCESFHLDIVNSKDVEEIMCKVSPDITIHTAALTNVDYCETHKKKAFSVNFMGTKNIVNACEKVNSKMVYISTDYVFDGEKGMYREEDEVNPIDYYGETKLRGEKAVQGLSSNYLIVRPSVLYGWHLNLNFVTWVIKELKLNHRINVVDDQFNTPTLADNLAELILELIKQDEEGIYHASGRERINRFDFAEKIADTFYLDKNLINQVTSRDLKWIAKRPRDSSLDVSKISRILKPLDISEGLNMMKGGR